jgi:class 3 adenylate cyclase
MSDHGQQDSKNESKATLAELRNELVLCQRELTEALRRQAATSEILRAMSRSQTDLQAVFNMIAENAVSLCEAEVSSVFQFDGELVHLKAVYGSSAAATEAVRRAFPMVPSDASAAGRAIRDCATIQISDIRTDKGYLIQDAALRAGFCSLLAVPMIHEGKAIGAVAVGRAETGKFSDQQDQLLATFAEQAVIAIENVRLFEEVQSRTLELERLSSHLAKYLSPQIYDSIFSGRQEVKLISQRKRLSVFFSDLEGFTETTEKLEPEDVSRLLNQYLTEMSEIALAHGATIDKYVGDAIVIFFGDPETRGVKEDALACVTMAIAMRKKMKELESIWMDTGLEKPLHCRMGITTDVCTVGNFGSEDRMDYTIIGGGVNLASRLQTACRPNEILITYETYAHVKDHIECEEEGQVEVKGISHPISTYRVVDLYENLEEERQPIRTRVPHLRLDVDVSLMSAKEKRQAAAVLLEAAERLSSVDPDS